MSRKKGRRQGRPRNAVRREPNGRRIRNPRDDGTPETRVRRSLMADQITRSWRSTFPADRRDHRCPETAVSDPITAAHGALIITEQQMRALLIYRGLHFRAVGGPTVQLMPWQRLVGAYDDGGEMTPESWRMWREMKQTLRTLPGPRIQVDRMAIAVEWPAWVIAGRKSGRDWTECHAFKGGAHVLEKIAFGSSNVLTGGKWPCMSEMQAGKIAGGSYEPTRNPGRSGDDGLRGADRDPA